MVVEERRCWIEWRGFGRGAVARVQSALIQREARTSHGRLGEWWMKEPFRRVLFDEIERWIEVLES